VLKAPPRSDTDDLPCLGRWKRRVAEIERDENDIGFSYGLLAIFANPGGEMVTVKFCDEKS
jgi:hypothetical protein